MNVYIALSKVYRANKEENGRKSNVCIFSFLSFFFFAVFMGNKLASGKVAYISLRVLDTSLDRLEKAVATHSSALAWQIPWTEEPGGLQSMGSLRVGHD